MLLSLGYGIGLVSHGYAAPIASYAVAAPLAIGYGGYGYGAGIWKRSADAEADADAGYLRDMADMVDMVDTDMEVMAAMEVMAEDTERDLLMLRLTLPSSTDLTAMLPPLLPTDMLSLPPLSDPTPSLLTELEDMD